MGSSDSSMDSLGRSSAKSAEVLWLEAAQRRACEIDEGKVLLITLDELERRVQIRLNEVIKVSQMHGG